MLTSHCNQLIDGELTLISITRKLEFDAGHKVLGSVKCGRGHGHHFVCEITVIAPELDSLGMVIDFGVVKERVYKWILDRWDHNFLLSPLDPLIMDLSKEELIHLLGCEPYVMPNGNPTAENLAKVLFDVATELLPPPLEVVHVRMYETPNCFADYTPND